MLVFTPAIHFAAFFQRFTCFLNSYRDDSRYKTPPRPTQPDPFMNNNSRPVSHLRSLSATFAAFHISMHTALRHRPDYIVPLLSEGVHTVEYFLFGQVPQQHHLS